MSSKKKPITEITVETRTLHSLLKPVLPCADTTGMLPVLNAVKVELRGPYLLASATDRFRLALCRQPLAYGEDYEPAPAPKGVEFDALIDVPDVQHLLKLFPLGRHGQGNAVKLTIDGDKLYAEAAGGFGFTFNDLRVSYTLNDGKFPDLETIAHGVLTASGEPVKTLGVNPEYLASFKAAALDRHDAFELIVPKETGKPLVCKVGDHFLGLVVPKTNLAPSSTDREAADWSEFLRPAKTEGAAA